jgi:hypothetical protein
MAEVWLARQHGAFAGASKQVAIKLMADHLAADPGFQQLFESEVRLSMLLSHSNIVQVFDAGREDGHTYLVMEWVEGLDLSRLEDHMRRSGAAFDVDVAVHVVTEILRGLAYAHRVEHEGRPAGIVHRDVSPQNVLVSVSGEVKLTDFGVARLAIDKTTGHDVRGKLRYMAPEQALGRSRSPTVDLYSVGAILHELLSGTRFRSDHDPDALRVAVLRGDVPATPHALPSEVELLRQRLLAADPTQRFQSAEEALAAIEQWPGSRRRTETIAQLCRRALEHAPASAFERTDRGDHRWAGLDGTATQTATTAEVTRTPTRTIGTSGPSPMAAAPSKAKVGTAIAIVVGALLGVGVLSAIVAFSLRDIESDPSRDDNISYNSKQSGPVVVGEPPPSYGRMPPKDAPMPIHRPPPVQTHPGALEPAEDTGHHDRDEDTGSAADRELPSDAALHTALVEPEQQARACGDPGVERLELELTFVGETGLLALATVTHADHLDPELRTCIEDAFIGTTIGPFASEVHRVTHTLHYGS